MTNKTINESAKLLKALGSPVRLRIVAVFLENEKNCLCEIQPLLKLSQPTLSRHIAVLRDCGILKHNKVNNRIYYKIKDTAVKKIFAALGITATGKDGRHE